MNNYSVRLIIYQALPYLRVRARGLRGGTSGAAEESLRTGEAKISDKAPRSHETRGRRIKKKKKRKKDSWRSERMLLSGANESRVFSRPAFKNCNQESSTTETARIVPDHLIRRLHAGITARRSRDDVNTGRGGKKKKKETIMQHLGHMWRDSSFTA